MSWRMCYQDADITVLRSELNNEVRVFIEMNYPGNHQEILSCRQSVLELYHRAYEHCNDKFISSEIRVHGVIFSEAGKQRGQKEVKF